MVKALEETSEVCLGPISAIPPGEGREFVVRDVEVAVFRQRDGGLHAVQSKCPHRDGPLADGILASGQVLCPYHSYRFDLSTGACLTDPTCNIRVYEVR